MTLLPTELVGSYALPSWLWVVLERIEETGDLGEADTQETLNDAVSIAVLDQERAGLDVITDGEMCRRDFIQSFYSRLGGLTKLDPERHFGAAGYDQNPRYEVIGPITAPAGLGIVAEFNRLREATSKPTKICVPGPMTLALPLLLRSHYESRDQLLGDMATIVKDELNALVRAGATYVQIDEPRYISSHEDAARLVELFNSTRAGITAQVGLHVCFGNFKGRARDRRNYSALFPALLDADADQFNLEFANREYSQVELLSEFGPTQRVGVGVIDVKSYFVETPNEVADGIRRALAHVRPENVVLIPDCGLNHCPRHVAFQKLLALSRGAEIVRQELSGQ
jgi:5-methyltetrahydropteroyltriglutamate--homocysteine methyltransferase